MGPLSSAHPPPVLQKATQAFLALVTLQTGIAQSRTSPHSAHRTKLSADGGLGSPAQMLNKALINDCKLQRTQLTVTERSTEAARS